MPKQKKPINRKPLHIRTGDQVIVISGDDKGDTPRQVLSVLPKRRKVIVEGVNVMKDRHQKQRQQQRASGLTEQDVIEKPFPIDASKVMLFDPSAKKRTRVRITGSGDSRKRVAVKSGEEI